MKTVSTIADLKQAIKEIKTEGKTIAFVPTMGNLHSGHLSLVHKGNEVADVVVASIFVNPTQFGENEDLSNYPRTLEEDKKKLISEGCNLLFTPEKSDMYPKPDLAVTQVKHMSTLHCGASRPNHFNGVTTIVMKLFNLVQPDFGIFGLKDFQQFTILKTMVKDMFMPVEMIGVDTGRAEDGLAHSSRNNYLTAEEREIAPTLYQVICETKEKIISGKHSFANLIRDAKKQLADAGMTPDYFAICRQIDLNPATENDMDLVVLAAAYLGKARLIDNTHFSR